MLQRPTPASQIPSWLSVIQNGSALLTQYSVLLDRPNAFFLRQVTG